MKAETLVPNHPPTPPNASTELQSGLHQIVQYNAGRNYSYEDPSYFGAGYGSPGPAMQDGLSQHSSHIESQPSVDFGVEIEYDGFGRGSVYYQEGQSNGLPSNQAMFSDSPPTPRSATENDSAARRTRSGRTIITSSSPGKEEKPRRKATSKTKKGKVGKSEKPKMPKLTAPLSVLTKNLTHIPVRNMEEWVNRPVEVRRREVEKRNGYITRPMNSFMLYRSAYAERTKQWCFQNNHQVVSSVSGESWPMEPLEVRELYNEYAKIERINHQNAHPTYKFSPSKAATAARKRKGEFSDEDEPSDPDDVEWAPGQGRARQRHSGQLDRYPRYSTNEMSADFFDRAFGTTRNGINRSSWEMTNEGRPLPMPMTEVDLYNQYFQASVHPNMGITGSVLEDLQLRQLDTPGVSMQFSPDHALLGLPGGNVTDIMQQLQPHHSTPLGDPQVDPMLLAFDSSHAHNVSIAAAQHPEFRNSNLGMMDQGLGQHSVDNLLGTTHGREEFHLEPWQPDPSIGSIEQESEFEKWMGDH